jgi:acyl-[acyl-carrier-protein]-phospholipid O-acyltransferase/long-chain-fatty-acid--[acyl-carrier-protein] ligase
VSDLAPAFLSARSLTAAVDARAGAEAVAIGLLAAALAVVCWLRPVGPLRLVLALLTRSLYRLRVEGRSNVPARGPTLLVCHAVNYLDWPLLLAAVPRRVRPLVLAGWAGKPWLRRLLRWVGAVAVDGKAGPRDVARALRAAGEALKRGEAVLLFAESCVTTGGLDLSLRRVFRLVARRGRAPVIPVCLDQPYGSLFSIYGGRLLRKPFPAVPYRIGVRFGAPLPPGAGAAEVRQTVQRLSADYSVDHPRRRPVHRQFVRMAARHPFRSCLIDSPALGGRQLSYGKTLAGAWMLARTLRPLLGEAPHVGVWLPPSVGGALANVALALLGKTSVNLNYSSSPAVVESSLRQSGATRVVTSRKFTAKVKLEAGPGVDVLYLEDLVPRIPKWRGVLAYLAVLLLPGAVLDRWLLGLARHRPDDLATLVFSSGSTGEPKGVMLTHGNVAANVGSMLQATGAGPRDRILGVLPLFHSFGYTVTLWTPLQVGASVVYHPDPRQAREIGELCRRYRCTIYLSTATFLRFCLKKCAPGDFDSLNILVCGAEKLPVSLAEDFQRRFGVLPLEGYGCTELSPAAIINLPDVVVDGFRQIHNRPGTIGQPLPGVAARVVHPETGAPLPAGQEGMLLVHGANVMCGYLGKPERTAEVVRDGWYVTGDVGRVDEDGFVTLTGRLSRFAKVGGEMVPLERLEEELHDVLDTSDRVCGVTCVPDEARGERLAVLYVPPLLAQHNVDVRGWSERLEGRGLPNLWLPSERDFLPVPEIPVLGSGKVDLKRLKDLALELARK